MRFQSFDLRRGLYGPYYRDPLHSTVGQECLQISQQVKHVFVRLLDCDVFRMCGTRGWEICLQMWNRCDGEIAFKCGRSVWEITFKCETGGCEVKCGTSECGKHSQMWSKSQCSKNLNKSLWLTMHFGEHSKPCSWVIPCRNQATTILQQKPVGYNRHIASMQYFLKIFKQALESTGSYIQGINDDTMQQACSPLPRSRP